MVQILRAPMLKIFISIETFIGSKDKKVILLRYFYNSSLSCRHSQIHKSGNDSFSLHNTFTAPVSGGEVNFLITEVTSARLTIHVDMDCCCNRPGEVCVGCGTSELCVKEFPVHRPEGDLVPHRPVDAQHVERVVDQSTTSRPRHSGGRNSWNNTHCQILDSGTTTLLYCSHNS